MPTRRACGIDRFDTWFRPSYIRSMPPLRKRTPLEIPPEISKRFMQDMLAFFAEENAIKRDEIAARQLDALREHRRPRDPKLRLSDVKELFAQMREYIKSGD
jgi:hypothetical protein